MNTQVRKPARVAQTLLWMLMGGAVTLFLWVAAWEIWPWLSARGPAAEQVPVQTAWHDAPDAGAAARVGDDPQTPADSAPLSLTQLQQSAADFPAGDAAELSGSITWSDPAVEAARANPGLADSADQDDSAVQADRETADAGTLAPGQMYRWRDANGVLHFSDHKPAADAEIVEQGNETLSVYEGMSARQIRDGLTPDKPARRKQDKARQARSSGGPTLVVAMDARCEWTHGRIVALNDLIAQGGNGKESVWQKERSKRCGEWRKYCAEHLQRLRC